MPATWVEINENLPLQPGDEVRLYYSTIGTTYLTAAQIGIIEDRLEYEKRFEVLCHSLPKKEGWTTTFYFEVKIITPPAEKDVRVQEAGLITAAMIAAVIMGIAAGIMWLALQKQEKKVEQRQVELEIVQAGGEIPKESGTAESIDAAGNTILKAAAALAALAVLWSHNK